MLRSSMVSTLLSSGIIGDGTLEKSVHEDTAARLREELAQYAIDRRTIAIGGSEEIWQNDLFSSMEDAWWSLILGISNYAEMILLTKQPKSILCITPSMVIGTYVWANKHQDVDVTFMNSHGLYVYENHLAPYSEKHALTDYSVVDYQDIVENSVGVGTYDYIYAVAWDIVSDRAMQDACVNILNPGGVLFVSLTNNGTKLYRDSYHSHPYTAFHTNLKSKNGSIFHVPAHYGFTVFSKD